MDAVSIVNLITSIIAIIAGVSGLILGILNYFNDKPKILVNLSWDMETYEHLSSLENKDKLWGVITVSNVGRRPVYVSHIHLEAPWASHILLIMEGLNGEKLQEGDAPKSYPVTQEGLKDYANNWKKLRAVAFDSTGKKYYSKPTQKKPSWAS